MNATALQVNGTNISSTYATQTALGLKQDALTVVSSNTPLISGTTVRTLAAGSNVNLTVNSNVITIDVKSSGHALTTDQHETGHIVSQRYRYSDS